MIYLAAGILLLWGLGHLAPTRSIVGGFGALTVDNRRILTMEWIAEGFTLVFLGVLVTAVTLLGDGPTVALVCRLAAGMLVVMAALSFATGARTAILPMKACPWVKLTAAGLLFVGSARL